MRKSRARTSTAQLTVSSLTPVANYECGRLITETNRPSCRLPVDAYHRTPRKASHPDIRETTNPGTSTTRRRCASTTGCAMNCTAAAASAALLKL